MTVSTVAGARAPRNGWSGVRPARRLALLALAASMLVSVAAAPSAFAITPSNDRWESPFNVDLAGGDVTVDSREAFAQTGEPLTEFGTGVCNEHQMVATTWYRILGNGGTVSVDTFGSNFDTIIAVYPAPTPTLENSIACNDDAGGTIQSAASFASVAGSAYLVQVGGCRLCGTNDAGDMVMHVSATAPEQPNPVVVTPPPVQQTVVVPPPDSDGDGITDAKDTCPTQKPSVDANNDGCQDPPKRILSELKYKFNPYRRLGRVRGQALTRVRLTLVPAGARIRVTCARCQKADSRGRTRKFRTFTQTAKRDGSQSMPRLNRVLLPRGGRLVVVVTRPTQLGRRIIVRVNRGDPTDSRACLAVGSTTRRVACSSGG